jgi:glycine/D-amino acid oxidase-like deaminating enzyme
MAYNRKMNQNNSPWLFQLKRTRPVDMICTDQITDVVVVGGGIAGVMTSYFILKNTNRQVTLIEGNKVAHGATGHNAGQLVSEFERPFTDLVREYGLDKSISIEEDVQSAWVLLENIIQELKIETPLSTFMGYNGYKYKAHIIDQLKANVLRQYGGAPTLPIYISAEWLANNELPEEFAGQYESIPQENISSLLETDNTDYVCVTQLKKGCTNSALLTEEIVGYLLAEYKDRFTLFEHSSVSTINLNKDDVHIEVSTSRKDGKPEDSYSIRAKRIVLCTNGFERLNIKNIVGDDINTSFHHMINGDIGYMAAYIEELSSPPTAIGYYDEEADSEIVSSDAYTAAPYFYKTRRPYEIELDQMHNLICIGGPEQQIAETQDYDRYSPFLKEKGDQISDFVSKTIVKEKDRNLEYRFEWHGIMCYTPNNMRVVGAELRNPVLMYNLGCNGVGILPAIFGASKISRIINGEKFDESIFDPK